MTEDEIVNLMEEVSAILGPELGVSFYAERRPGLPPLFGPSWTVHGSIQQDVTIFDDERNVRAKDIASEFRQLFRGVIRG